MKRVPAVLASIAAISVLSFGLSGCNVRFSPYAAVVNGTEISQTQLSDALSAISADTGYKCAIQSSGTTHIAGAGQGTYNAAFSAQVLSVLIQDKIVRQAVVRERIPEPSSLYPIALSQLDASTTPPSTCPGSGASLVAAFAPSYRSLLIKFQEDEDALAAALAGVTLNPTDLAAYTAAHKNLMSLACVSVIEVAAKATATSLRGQLLRGASFAALAKAHSVDTTSAPNGGALGCIPDAEFNAPLGADLAGLNIGRGLGSHRLQHGLAAPFGDQAGAGGLPAAGHEPDRPRASQSQPAVSPSHPNGQGPGRSPVRHLGYEREPGQGHRECRPPGRDRAQPERQRLASGLFCTGPTGTSA